MQRIFAKYIKTSLESFNRINLRKKFLYFTIFRKINIGFFITIPYNAYQGKLFWIKAKYINFRYHNRIKLIKKRNAKARYLKPRLFAKVVRTRITLLQQFLYTYTYFFFFIGIDLFYLSKAFQLRRQRLNHFLIFSFSKTRLYINLQNFIHKNYFFLSTGLFIKFFDRKKSLKKSKTIKLLIAKFLRKLFLITQLKHAILIIKKNPLFLLEMLNLFNTPVAYKFIDPTDEREIEEKPTDFLLIKFLYFVFLENKTYTFNKQKKKGRIKRKIFRKLILTNKIID